MITPEQARKMVEYQGKDDLPCHVRDALRELADKVEELQADAKSVRDSIPNLRPVIDWLENGCTLATVIEELRLYQAAIEHIKRAK